MVKWAKIENTPKIFPLVFKLKYKIGTPIWIANSLSALSAPFG